MSLTSSLGMLANPSLCQRLVQKTHQRDCMHLFWQRCVNFGHFLSRHWHSDPRLNVHSSHISHPASSRNQTSSHTIMLVRSCASIWPSSRRGLASAAGKRSYFQAYRLNWSQMRMFMGICRSSLLTAVIFSFHPVLWSSESASKKLWIDNLFSSLWYKFLLRALIVDIRFRHVFHVSTGCLGCRGSPASDVSEQSAKSCPVVMFLMFSTCFLCFLCCGNTKNIH